MRRRTFDFLLSSVGVILTIVLLAAGGLLTWAHSFANSNVHNQLAAQKIFFPPKGSEALASKDIGPYLNKYAGQQLTTGPQAKAYADHFIAVHLKKIGGGLTYSQLSAKAIANPNDTQLAGTVQTMFRGETLRGLLLGAYGWWKLGSIALFGAIVSFILAGVMFMLSALGFWHQRRTSPVEELKIAAGRQTVTV